VPGLRHRDRICFAEFLEIPQQHRRQADLTAADDRQREFSAYR